MIRRLRRPWPPASFTCPRCRRTSWNPTDVAEGYCAACHDWTRSLSPQRARQLDAEVARHGVTDPRPPT